ncbi:17554_t:CDS:1, partial [Racocetra persica]
EKGPLRQTNLVKYRIETGNALPIKQYPYHHSHAKKVLSRKRSLI